MTMTTAEAREHFSEVVNRAAYGKERVVLTRHRKKLAAVVPIEDLEFLEALEDRLDVKAALLALEEAKEKGTIPWEEVKKDLGL